MNIDTYSYFIKHLIKVGKALTGTIVVGGLITRIVIALDCYLHRLEEAKGSSRIDLEEYIAIKMIVKDDECYCLILRNQLPHLLPDHARTTVQNLAIGSMTTNNPPLKPIDMGCPSWPSSTPGIARHYFAFDSSSTKPTQYDFSNFYTSLNIIRAEQVE